jgi:hypothetical protein
MYGDIELENGKESYGNIPMAVKETGPPGISGVATMPLGLTKRVITVTGILVGEDGATLKSKQETYEAEAQSGTLKSFITGNERTFDDVRWVSITWNRVWGNAVTGKCDAEYTAVFEQLVPGVPVG